MWWSSRIVEPSFVTNGSARREAREVHSAPARTSATRSCASGWSPLKNGSASDRELTSSDDRAHPLAEAVALAHVRLQVDRREVAVVADPLALERRDHTLARLVVGQEDDVDEPRADVVGVVGARQLDAVDVAQELVVAARPRASARARISSSRSSWPMPIAAATSLSR